MAAGARGRRAEAAGLARDRAGPADRSMADRADRRGHGTEVEVHRATADQAGRPGDRDEVLAKILLS